MASLHSLRTGPTVNISPEPDPRTLQIAAGMFVLYGIAVVLNAVIFAAVGGPRGADDVLRMLLQPLGAALVAWGLLHRARWAWWGGLGLALSVLATGILVLSVFEHGDVYWLPPSSYQLFFVGGLLSAAAAVALLFAPSARTGVYFSWASRRAGRREKPKGGCLPEPATLQSLMNTHW